MTDTIIATLDPQSEQRPSAPPPTAKGPIDHDKTVKPFNLSTCLRHATKVTGKSAWAQTIEMWRLFMGRGGVTPFEYFYYNLWDDTLTAEQKRAFVGKRLRTRVTNKILDNYFYGVGLDKIAFYASMKGFGLPVPKTHAIFHPTRMLDGAVHLRSREAFEEYLRDAASYPCFTKPSEATASIGAASLERYCKESDEVELANGRRFPVSRFVDEAARYLAAGYLVQERLRPHAEIERISGSGLSTVRVMVLAPIGDAPQIIRATWRLPVGEGFADVHWRGNLMAALDPETGTVERAIRGSGPNFAEIDVHPDSGEQLSGCALPMWPAVRDLCTLAASALPKLELTGWDVAVTDCGPVLVELEPDGGEPTVTQLASGKGLLDGPYGEFLREHEAAKKAQSHRAERVR